MDLQDLTQVSKLLGKGSILGRKSEETSALGLRRAAQRPGTAVRPEQVYLGLSFLLCKSLPAGFVRAL